MTTNLNVPFKEIPANDPTRDPARRALIDQVLKENRGLPGAMMVVLNELQSKIGYITEPMQVYVARKMHVPVSAIHGVVTFYSFFTTQPRGLHTIKFCMGTACYVGGTPQLLEKVKQLTGTNPGRTTPDGKITIEICRCVGACSQAPVIVVDDEVQGRVRPNKLPQVVKRISE